MAKKNVLQLHAFGVPPSQVPRFETVARAAMQAGCSLLQARGVAMLAYYAASGLHFRISGAACGLEINTKLAKGVK